MPSKKETIQEREAIRSIFGGQPQHDKWVLENVPKILHQMGVRGYHFHRGESGDEIASRNAFGQNSDYRMNWSKALNAILNDPPEKRDQSASFYASTFAADKGDSRKIEYPHAWGATQTQEVEEALKRLAKKIENDFPQAYRGMEFVPEPKRRVPGEAMESKQNTKNQLILENHRKIEKYTQLLAATGGTTHKEC